VLASSLNYRDLMVVKAVVAVRKARRCAAFDVAGEVAAIGEGSKRGSSWAPRYRHRPIALVRRTLSADWLTDGLEPTSTGMAGGVSLLSEEHL